MSLPNASDAGAECFLSPYFGMNVVCSHAPSDPGDMYDRSDVCRRFLHCTPGDGGCVLSKDPELAACVACFEACVAAPAPCAQACQTTWKP